MKRSLVLRGIYVQANIKQKKNEKRLTTIKKHDMRIINLLR